MSLDLSSTILDLIKSVNDVLENKLSLSGGTLTGNVLLSNSNAQGSQPNLKWKTINSKTPYVGYCTGSTDGTFMIASIGGTTYTTGLSIGGTSGNLLWKGTQVATTSDIPTALKNPNALKFGSKTYDGSSAQTITASDIGADVTVTPTLTTGKEIASIKVGSTTTKLYAPNGFEIVELTGDSGTLTSDEYWKIVRGETIIKWNTGVNGKYEYYSPFGYESIYYRYARVNVTTTSCDIYTIDINQNDYTWSRNSTTFYGGGSGGSGGSSFQIVELKGDSGTLTSDEYGKLTSGSSIIRWKSGSSTGFYQYYMPFGFDSPKYTFAKVYISDTDCVLNVIEIDQVNKSWTKSSTTYGGIKVTQTLTSGVEIGAIKVGSTTTKLYAPSSTGGGITSDEVANMINTAINGALEDNY